MTASYLRLARLVCVASLAALGSVDTTQALPAAGSRQASVEPNDNQRPAGTLENGTLSLALRAGVGAWKPEGPAGPALSRPR